MRTVKTRTTIAALAAAAVLSTTGATGVASAAVPDGALGETPTTVEPTTDPTGVPPAPQPVTTSEPPTVAPSGPSTAAQVFLPQGAKKVRYCNQLQDWYEQSIAGAVQIEGNPDGDNQTDAQAANADRAATETREAGQKAGCAWAK